MSSVRWTLIGRPVLFATGFTVSSFSLAAWCEHKRRAAELSERQRHKPVHPRFSAESSSSSLSITQTPSPFDFLSNLVKGIHPVLLGIVGCNVLTFLLWKVPNPRLQRVLSTYFISGPKSPKVLPHFFSMFSHQSAVHLGVNMFALLSFGRHMVLGLGPELFLAIYSSAGVFASVLSRLTALAGRRELLDIGSLGASHCVLAIFALSSCFYPQSRVQIVFLPFFSFSADSALKAMIAVETIALIASLRGIRVLPFDHAAHLGGLLFGLGFYHVGSHLWIRRNRFIRSITGEKR